LFGYDGSGVSDVKGDYFIIVDKDGDESGATELSVDIAV
jgi:hypothetical protein